MKYNNEASIIDGSGNSRWCSIISQYNDKFVIDFGDGTSNIVDKHNVCGKVKKGM